MTQAANDEGPLGREEQAALWCSRVADGPLAPWEQKAFDAWLDTDPQHRAAFDDMVLVWQGIDAIAEMPGFVSLRAKALTTMEQARSSQFGLSRRSFGMRAAIAGAVALLLIVTSGIWMMGKGADSYTTGVGERRVVRLEDGSRISLDAASEVSVEINDDKRALILVRGRAKFDVAKDPLRPFTVAAGRKTIVATGTAFSVELLHREVRVLLYEGQVTVLSRLTEGKRAAPVRILKSSPAQVQRLEPGDELVTSLGSDIATVTPADVDKSLSWEAGRLTFIDEPLSSAIERVNRYSDSTIEIGEPSIANLLVNGVFDAGNTRSFVSGVTSLHPVAARRANGRIILVREEVDPR